MSPLLRCLLWTALATPPSGAAPPLETLPRADHDDARAREAWDRGAAAFAAGRLDEAIEQFELTYRHSGRPGPLFSLGQAHRHLWEQGEDDGQRLLAIKRYQQYLDVDPEGRRSLEAQRWITLLESKGELEDLGDAGRVFTRLGVTSRTAGASASIDGGTALELPSTPDVAPGRHRVVVSAPGYRAQHRDVDVPEGSTLPLELTLDPIDALLTVRGPAGAELYIDGQRIARLPTRTAVAVPPGTHQIGVAQRGRTLFVRELELERAGTASLDARLERTGQRKVAIATVAIGSAAATASVVTMALAFDAQRRARDIQDEISRKQTGITEARFEQRTALIERRDALRSAAIATGVSGLGLLATGFLLWITDRPPVASQLRPVNVRGRAFVRPAVAATASFAGGSLTGAF